MEERVKQAFEDMGCGLGQEGVEGGGERRGREKRWSGRE